jgi:peptide/nickel transport system permease protein
MSRVARWCLLLIAVVGLLAPLLSNDVPLLASVGGELQAPALQSLLGRVSPPPGRDSWKEWWARLPDQGGDWAVMPLWPYGPDETHAGRILAPPDLEHPLGNDDVGRDQLARLVHGAGPPARIGLLTLLLAALVGIPLGALAGYRGGLADQLVLRLIELVLCFPALLLVMTMLALLGRSELTTAVVLGALAWAGFARIVRGEFLSLREREFVQAARGLGVAGPRIVFRHMLPQVAGSLRVTAAFLLAAVLTVETTLSFLGFGVGYDRASWGAMLAQGREHAATGVWHLWVVPGLAIVATVTCLHAMADRRAAR